MGMELDFFGTKDGWEVIFIRPWIEGDYVHVSLANIFNKYNKKAFFYEKQFNLGI